MIQFYLEEVMPQAESQGLDIKEPVSSLGEKLKTLRLQLRRCVSSRPLPPLQLFGFPFGNTHRLTPLTPRHTLWVAGACSVLSEQGWGDCEAFTCEDLQTAFLLFVSHLWLINYSCLCMRGAHGFSQGSPVPWFPKSWA